MVAVDDAGAPSCFDAASPSHVTNMSDEQGGSPAAVIANDDFLAGVSLLLKVEETEESELSGSD